MTLYAHFLNNVFVIYLDIYNYSGVLSLVASVSCPTHKRLLIFYLFKKNFDLICGNVQFLCPFRDYILCLKMNGMNFTVSSKSLYQSSSELLAIKGILFL